MVKVITYGTVFLFSEGGAASEAVSRAVAAAFVAGGPTATAVAAALAIAINSNGCGGFSIAIARMSQHTLASFH